MGKVLIITHSADNEAVTSVMDQISATGATPLRFNVDRYPIVTRLTSEFHGSRRQLLLEDGSGAYPLEDLTAVWYRRSYHIAEGLDQVLEKPYLTPAAGEIRRTLFGMLESLPCFQLERYSTYRRLDSKEEQLRLAVECGLLVPATCITNSPERLQAFMREVNGPIVAKMQSAFAIYQDGQEQVVFTSEIREDHLEQLPQLRFCPMTFQEKLPKALELRVNMVGTSIFAFSIDSQQQAGAETDWRKEGAALAIQWRPYDLPAEVAASLSRLMDRYGLNYGAIDLILTPDGKYYFLELNAAGEFFWLDKLCDGAISRQLAAVLTGSADRRTPLIH
ncbi:MvdC/MvdD family ATP grasp protein [Chitinophaga deserti]|uniref:MvdC/MvdD family ATP grasp protein n=1 Tax=Chitinophaga deserti TaxID=2164099 RepID=UPI000D6CAB7E|nr:MvdD family ATP-grasp ribosomal peptide maturase [Chitinophaga deserti]